jgi:hypothetical protein
MKFWSDKKKTATMLCIFVGFRKSFEAEEVEEKKFETRYFYLFFVNVVFLNSLEEIDFYAKFNLVCTFFIF